MGIFTKELCTADVEFYGVTEDLSQRPRAFVVVDSLVEWDSEFDPLAALIPLALVRHMHNANGAWEVIDPLSNLIRRIAEEVLEDESVCPTFKVTESRAAMMARITARELARVGMAPNATEALLLGMPESGQRDEVPDREFTATLLRSRKKLWAKIRVSWLGPVLVGSWGVLALIEELIRTRDYETGVVPGMAALHVLASTHGLIVEEGHTGPLQLSEVNQYEQLINAVCSAPDPRAVLAELAEP